jgi:hypothetical protein
VNSTPTIETVSPREERAASRRSGRRFSRRSFLKWSAAGVGGLALYSAEIARHELTVEERTIHLKRLPDAFRGMRIVQISDFHYEVFTEPFFLREMVRRVNQLRPDMVLLTGDFITQVPHFHSMPIRAMVKCAAILSEIACPLRYASLGNHDEGIGPRHVIGPLEEHGIPVLWNRFIPLERDGQRLWLGAVGSACVQDAHPESAVPKASLRDNEPIILMAHEPDILPEVARYNVDLMLSGHTHGGQVRVPFLPPFVLPPFGQRYVEGLFRYGPTQLYVNRGIGTVGLPLRLFCPPEITVFTLA